MASPAADAPRSGVVGARPGRGLAPIPPAQITIAELSAADWPAAARIEQGIVSGNASFEPRAPTWEEFCLRARGPPRPGRARRAVSRARVGVLGRDSAQDVYPGVGTVSIYVDPAVSRRGVEAGSSAS